MTTRTLTVDALSYRVPLMVEKFEAVAKRAKRLGKGSISWDIGESFTRQERMPYSTEPVTRMFNTVSVTFDVPMIGGWDVLGVLLRPALDGQATFQGTDDVAIPSAWLDRDVCGVCDHCGTKRRRNFTVVLRNMTDGNIKKVGSACLQDFTGHSPVHALFAATLFGELREIFQMVPPPGSNMSWDLVDFLAKTVARIRTSGWVPASMRDTLTPTVDAVLDGKAPAATEGDESKAAKVAAWAKALNRGSNDYLNNVRAVARDGYVTRKTAGVAASMVAAYDRDHEVKPVNTSEYFGKEGDRATFQVKLESMAPFHGYYGNGMVYRFTTGTSDLVWFASGEGLGDTCKPGDTVTVKATVKKHEVRNGRKQTVLNRVALA